MEKLVSVVIPTYNTADYITQTLDSVLGQTFKNYEIIVVDDGSTDHTGEVLSSYMNRINYIHQENSGRSEARNTGIKAARGKYVAFLDSDDLWTPEKLRYQVEIMENHSEIDFLFGDKQRFADDGSILIHSMFKEKGYDETFFGDPLYVKNAYKKLLNDPYIPTGTVIMKTRCFEDTGLFDRDIYAEDWEFWLRAALLKTIAYVNEIWELERDRPGSGSKNLKAVYQSHIVTLEKHERLFKKALADIGVDMNQKIKTTHKNNGAFFWTTDKHMARQSFGKALARGGSAKTLLCYMLTFFPDDFADLFYQRK